MSKIIQPFAPAFSGGGPSPYHASAVHVDGSTFPFEVAAPLSGVADTPLGFYSLWIKPAAVIGVQTLLDNDTSSANITIVQSALVGHITYNLFNAAGTKGYAAVGTDTAALAPSIWAHVLVAWDTNHGAGSKLQQTVINGAAVAPASTTDASTAFNVGYSTQTFTDFAPFYQGDLADVQFYPGLYPDFTNPTNLAALISGGKPVDPATAVALFGTPAILLSGNSSTFGVNQGSGGTVNVLGSVTDASTSPSD